MGRANQSVTVMAYLSSNEDNFFPLVEFYGYLWGNVWSVPGFRAQTKINARPRFQHRNLGHPASADRVRHAPRVDPKLAQAINGLTRSTITRDASSVGTILALP